MNSIILILLFVKILWKDFYEFNVIQKHVNKVLSPSPVLWTVGFQNGII